MRISDWSSDVCSSDLIEQHPDRDEEQDGKSILQRQRVRGRPMTEIAFAEDHASKEGAECEGHAEQGRSEEHTSELQSLMRTSYAVFCLKKKIEHTTERTAQSRATHE